MRYLPGRKAYSIRMLDRRRFLQSLAALGLLAAAPARAQVNAKPRFAANPFSLGVASGYPQPGGFVLWTRLAPIALAPGGGMAPGSGAQPRHGRSRDARGLSEPLRALQDRCGSAGGASGLPVARHLGRSRGRERLRQRSLAIPRHAGMVPRAARGGVQGVVR